MSATRLNCAVHAKPWGRPMEQLGWVSSLLSEQQEPDARIGELWFGEPADQVAAPGNVQGVHAPDLLLKVLTTSEPLSVQVHPDDAYARTLQLPCGKHEAWIVVEAAPDARIALGPKRAMSSQALRQAALDGTLPERLTWLPVRPGDVINVPPGTIHAIGGGLTLLEVQQPVDATFRLFDYARGRELHLEAGCAVSRLHPYCEPITHLDDPREQVMLCEAGPFTLEAWRWVGRRRVDLMGDTVVWCVPLSGRCEIDGQPAPPMTAWQLHGPCHISLSDDARVVAAYTGRAVHGAQSRGGRSPVSLSD